MENILQLIMAFLGSLGFALMFNTKRDILFPACLGGMLAWLVYLIALKKGCDPFLSGFLASLFTGLYSECMARLYKKPATIFIAIGEIPLIPGSGLYYSIYYLLLQNLERSLYYAIYTLLFASCMSAGIILMNIVFSQSMDQIHKMKK